MTGSVHDTPRMALRRGLTWSRAEVKRLEERLAAAKVAAAAAEAKLDAYDARCRERLRLLARRDAARDMREAN